MARSDARFSPILRSEIRLDRSVDVCRKQFLHAHAILSPIVRARTAVMMASLPASKM
ncbi:MAG: hypothetical protein MZU79_01120 [Anaerotruncus sp.]|nr:hypothetical protein [Anaerotruncus sp.]